MINKEKLQPCPFCGSENLESGKNWYGGEGYVHCHGCGGHMEVNGLFEDLETKAILNWNKRVKIGEKPTKPSEQTMADNRMFLVHLPTGLAAPIAKRTGYGWHVGEKTQQSMGIIGAGIQLFKTGSIQEIGGISPSIDF